MKKTKQIDTYYCDYCGIECEHTPEFVIPEMKLEDFLFPNSLKFKVIKAKQKDICSECQKKIISLLALMNKVKIEESISGMEITF